MHFNRSNLFDKSDGEFNKNFMVSSQVAPGLCYFIPHSQLVREFGFIKHFFSADILSALPNCVLQTQYIKQGGKL